MRNIVSQRFVECVEKLKANNRIRSGRQFATALDFLPQSLSEIMRGKRDVTIELLRKAIDKYGINPIYVFTGDGNMFLNSANKTDMRILTIVTDDNNDERIVHVPKPAQAGYAAEMSEPTFVQNLPTFSLPDYKYQSGTHRSFDVAGDSMQPTLFEGDKVVCSFIEPDHWKTYIKNNYIYIIVTAGDVVVKRVQNNLKEKKSLKLISDNLSYEPYEIHWRDIKEVWYVRVKISPFLPSPVDLQGNLGKELNELKKFINIQSAAIRDLQKKIDKL